MSDRRPTCGTSWGSGMKWASPSGCEPLPGATRMRNWPVANNLFLPDENPCETDNQCKNNGECYLVKITPTHIGTACKCPPGYKDDYCEIRKWSFCFLGRQGLFIRAGFWPLWLHLHRYLHQKCPVSKAWAVTILANSFTLDASLWFWIREAMRILVLFSSFWALRFVSLSEWRNLHLQKGERHILRVQLRMQIQPWRAQLRNT